MRKMAGPTNAKRSKCVCVTFILFLVAAVGYSAAESEDISENSEGMCGFLDDMHNCRGLSGFEIRNPRKCQHLISPGKIY